MHLRETIANIQSGAVLAGRYRLERAIGHGGMGEVWAATHLITQRPVAMKFVRAHLSRQAQMRRRLLREARAASAVRLHGESGAALHPNVIEVFDVFDLPDGTPVMVMELLRGETLAARLEREGPLELATTATLMLPLVSAVGTAHAVGVIHRDLKPHNVFLSEERGLTVVRVLDFGIARLGGGAELGEAPTLTAVGMMLGTPCYMAPEQLYGEPDVDQRADVWAVGVMLYELLTGGRPIEGNNVGQVLRRFTTQGITPISSVAPWLAEDVAQAVSSLLEPDRERRPRDLRELFAILSRHTTTLAPAFAGPGAASAPLESTARIDGRDSEAPVGAALESTAPHSVSRAPTALPPHGAARRWAWLAVPLLSGAALVAWSWPAPRTPLSRVDLVATRPSTEPLLPSASTTGASSPAPSAAAPRSAPSSSAPKRRAVAKRPAPAASAAAVLVPAVTAAPAPELDSRVQKDVPF